MCYNGSVLCVSLGGNLDVMSHIVRCNAVEAPDGSIVYHVGAEFEHMSRPVMNKLIRYLFAVQRRYIVRGVKM